MRYSFGAAVFSFGEIIGVLVVGHVLISLGSVWSKSAEKCQK